MQSLILSIAFSLISIRGICQIVNIPDTNFKNYLLNNPSINTNSDGEIQVSEASVFTDTIDVYELNIFDLTGIEAFTSLSVLNCAYNHLTDLNILENTALTHLSCHGNQLTSLDISHNTVLNYINFQENQLTSFDASANTTLKYLNCWGNNLTSLNISGLTALTTLYCNNNQLTTLNISDNLNLTYFNCWGNQLTNLIVSANPVLLQFVCNHNQLTSLNLSGYPALTQLVCWNNQLTSLNAKNGNNINFEYFYATGNPNLTCIQVDNATWSTANWTVANYSIDSTAIFSEFCSTDITELSDNSVLITYPNPATNTVSIETTLRQNTLLQTVIKNTLGQIVYTLNDEAGSGLYKKTIDLNLGQGIYFLTLQTNQGLLTKRIEIIK